MESKNRFRAIFFALSINNSANFSKKIMKMRVRACICQKKVVPLHAKLRYCVLTRAHTYNNVGSPALPYSSVGTGCGG